MPLDLTPALITDVLIRVAFFAMIIAAAAASSRVFQAAMRRVSQRGTGTTVLEVTTMGSWGIWLIGILFALNLLGLPAEILLVVLGLGVLGIVLASRDVLANWVAGQVITAYKPFKLGDWIRVGEHYGRVARLNSLDTVVVTPQNERVVVPNAMFVTRAVVNLTASRGIQVVIPFQAPRDMSFTRVEEAVLGVAAGMKDELLEGSEPEVVAVRLGGTAMELQLILTIGNPARMDDVRSDALKGITQKLERLSKKR